MLSATGKQSRAFAGRRPELRKAIRALADSTAILAIVGDPGVGKTAFLDQVERVAVGDYRTVGRLKISDALAAGPRRYQVARISCTPSVGDVAGLIALLARSTPIRDLLPARWAAPRASDPARIRLAAAQFGALISVGASRRYRREPQLTGLLVAVDHVDQLGDPTGLSRLALAMTGPHSKLALAGVAEAGRGLFDEPRPVEQACRRGSIHLAPLRTVEIRELCDLAAGRTRHPVRFHLSVVDRIATLSQGLPAVALRYRAQCLRAATRIGTDIVDDDVLERALEGSAWRRAPTLTGVAVARPGGKHRRASSPWRDGTAGA